MSIRLRRLTAPNWLQGLVDWAGVLAQHMSAREKTALGLLVLIVLISSAMSISGYIRRNTDLIPQHGGTYVESVVGEPRYLNPILASIDVDQDITSMVYSSLFKLNNNLDLEPDLATNHEVSADGKVYTVHLRRDVQWHDGQPFKADDVVFTIRSIQTPDYDSPLQNHFQGVTIDKVDDYTVRFTLRQPYAPFLYNLTVGIAPKHVWETIPPSNVTLAEQIRKPIGTGPFQFEQLVKQRKTGQISELQLVRNEKYYGKRPYIDKISFEFFPSHEEAVRAVLSGRADGVGFLPLAQVEDITSRSALNVHRIHLPQYSAIFFNENKNNSLSDTAVRSALALATDREEIITEALNGEAEALHVPIPFGQFSIKDTSESTFNPGTARQNLEEAGWKDTDNDGIREKDGNKLRVKITTTDWPEYTRTAELIQQQWREIGVEVELEQVSVGAIYQTVVAPREYEALIYGEILSADPDPYAFWHSTNTRSPGQNLSLLKDQEVDKLLEDARSTTDAQKRKELYEKFQQRFLELNPAIILYQPNYLMAHRDHVRGITVQNTHLPSGRFRGIENWHVKTKRVWK